jgi:hypothetical protein
MLRGLLPVTAGLMLMAGCSSDPLKPDTGPTQKEPGADLPYPTKAGTKWVYDTFDVNGVPMDGETVAVTGVERKGEETIVTLERSRGDFRLPTERLAVSRKGAATVAEVAGRGEARLERFRLPHTPGERWAFDLGAEKGTCTARRMEWVETPAGRFIALRVDGEGTIDVLPSPRSTEWYAAGVGLVKQTSDGNPHKTLRSFTPGKD